MAVCLFVCQRDNVLTTVWIFMKKVRRILV